MASQEQHIQQWKHNRAFLAGIEPKFPDWLVTVSFYVALHAVDTLLHHDGAAARVTSHDTRNAVLMGTNRYRKIWISYSPLYNLSRTVRYLADPSRWVQASQVQKQIVEKHLYPIENSIQQLMDVNLNLPNLNLIAAR